jgi:hypothetical protein
LSSGAREGREPVCPFCKTGFERPKKITLNAMEEVLGGTCRTCGAIFVVDQSGKNVGEVMMQALGMAADRLSKDISEMMPGEDYEDAVLSYDWRLHRSSGISTGFMDGSGRLYVVKIMKK